MAETPRGTGALGRLALACAALAAVAAAAVAVSGLLRSRREAALRALFERPAERLPAAGKAFFPGSHFLPAPGEKDDDRELRIRFTTPYRELLPPEALAISCPTDGAVYPANLCEPDVEWSDPRNSVWQLRVKIEGRPTESLATGATSLRLPKALWQDIKAAGSAELTVRGLRLPFDGVVQESQPVRVAVSPDPCDEYLIYRLTRAPFNPALTPTVYVRNVTGFEAKEFLNAREQFCLNCHTLAPAQSGKSRLSMQFRYTGTAKTDLPIYFAVYDGDTHEGVRVRLPFKTQMSTFMRWSPDGTKLLLSANMALATLVPVPHETQYAAATSADIAVYDPARNEAWLLPGASRPDRLEMLAEWSPDGRTIVFCSAPPGLHPADTRLELMALDWNDGRGGEPRPVEGASGDGMSSYFPRFSPDGLWLVFTKSRAEYLIKPSSDLYIMRGDLTGGARPLECNWPYAADSWHSWSSNSRWLVFSSKRDDGILTRLYLTHIDDEGRASIPVRLPEAHEHIGWYVYNIPEFSPSPPPAGDEDLFNAFRVEAPVRDARITAPAKEGR